MPGWVQGKDPPPLVVQLTWPITVIFQELNSPYDACVVASADLTLLECLEDSDCGRGQCRQGLCTAPWDWDCDLWERQKHNYLQFRSGGNSKVCAEGNLNFLHLSVTYKVPDKAHSSVTRTSRQTIPVVCFFLLLLSCAMEALWPRRISSNATCLLKSFHLMAQSSPALQLKYKASPLLSPAHT